jgi:hypothetical protein
MRPSGPPGSSTADTNADLLACIERRVGLGFETTLFSVLRSSSFPLTDCIGDLGSLLDSCAIRTAADALREEANRLTTSRIELRGRLDWLAGNGSSREQSRQVRYVVETYHVLEPVLAVIAAAARELLSGRSLVRPRTATDCWTGWVARAQGIDFAAEDDAAALFRGIFPRGPTHAFLRALAVWPDYAQKVQGDLSDEHRNLLASVANELQLRVEGLVFQLMAGVSERNRPGPRRLTEALDGCLNASCRVLPLIAALRRGLIQDEVAARKRRERGSEQHS